MDRFTSINAFKNVISTVRHHCHKYSKPLPTMTFTGQVKLHGTNAGVVRTSSGKRFAQSRDSILSIGKDNAGFAYFCESHAEAIDALFTGFPTDQNVTIFGEWCGGSIQPRVSLTQVTKHFVIFSIKVGESYVDVPADLHDNVNGIYNIKQIPSYEITIDFLNPGPASDYLTDVTMAIEEECPWVKLMFGLSGIGEGAVWHVKGKPEESHHWFKTKGLKHKNAGDKSKTARIKISDEKIDSLNTLAEELLPLWRLEQGVTYLREAGIPLIAQSTGSYLQWIARDILKEEASMILASGFEWKQINSSVMRISRNYYLTELERNFDD